MEKDSVGEGPEEINPVSISIDVDVEGRMTVEVKGADTLLAAGVLEAAKLMLLTRK